MSEYMFNIDNGYLEGLVRGFKGGILTQGDYLNLVQCETLEGKVLVLDPPLSFSSQSESKQQTRQSCDHLAFHLT